MTTSTPESELAETEEERAEIARDLRLAARQALGESDERKEWSIEDVSPRRRLYILYNMTDGERIAVPRFVFDTAIQRLIPGTRKFQFTAKKELAPKVAKGKVKCFMHPDAPEHELLLELGIHQTCTANELRNAHSRRIHGQHRHKNEWAAYQEAILERREDDYRDIQQKQLDATLALAKAAAGKGGA